MPQVARRTTATPSAAVAPAPAVACPTCQESLDVAPTFAGPIRGATVYSCSACGFLAEKVKGQPLDIMERGVRDVFAHMGHQPLRFVA